MRDSAILLLDPDGVITGWDEGAHQVAGAGGAARVHDHARERLAREAQAGPPERVLELVNEFVTFAERLSVASLKRAGRIGLDVDGPATPADASRE